ncbi:MAG: hypothetical protein KA314_03105 [Chloroflexi bacterium]|nr:hypothetical protein [Chloroflexota bacterium]MBP8054799.1 hypothetical protein [Chloroflexota bacterium]
METLGIIIGLVATVLVYSYLLGDNPLYRLAVHLLVGVSGGYAAVVALREVIWPVFRQLLNDPTNPATILWFVPLALALMLGLKAFPRFAWLGNSTMALLVGVGTAVALVGAIMGTLWPQIAAAAQPSTSGVLGGVVTALLTICTLLMFQFTGRNPEKPAAWQRGIQGIGQFVLTITFGALFAGILSTSLALLTYQLGQFLTLIP